MAATAPFDQQVVDAVTGHMNTNHPEDNVLVVKALGGQPEAAGAVMTGLAGTGADWKRPSTASPARTACRGAGR